MSKVSDQIGTRRDAWRNLVDALVAREVLPKERVPAVAPIDIEIEIDDQRADKSIQLPELPR